MTGYFLEWIMDRRDGSADVTRSAGRTGALANIGSKWRLPASVAAAVVVILIPFYGVMYPSLVDLPEHLLTSKILWETLAGTSNLGYVSSTFIGYKLFPYLVLIVMFHFKALGVSLIYLPVFISMALAAFFAASVTVILYFELPERSGRSKAIAAGLLLPALASMYTACWFIGFVNYMLGLTLVVIAVFVTERFLSAGGPKWLLLVFLAVLFAYLAHPFVPVFWVLWCLARGIASLMTWNIVAEWRRFLLLALAYLPIPLYHIPATSGSPLAPSTDPLTKVSPIATFDHWWNVRLTGLLDGTFLKADDMADSRYFAVFVVCLILAAIFTCFFAKPNKGSQRMMLSTLLFIFIASILNEAFFPIPSGHWLAYDYRFASTSYAISIVVSVAVLMRAMPTPSDTKVYRRAFAVLAAGCAVYSLGHLFSVRSAYARFDEKAHPFMDKVLANEDPGDIRLPHSKWHPDGTLIRLYICMVEPDCNPDGTTFKRVYTGDLYPVKLARYETGSEAQVQLRTPADPNALSAPRGLAADDMGNIYVADTRNGLIRRYGADGRLLVTFGTQGAGIGELKEPNGVAIDPDRRIYVTDAANAKLVRFAPDGVFEKEWTDPVRSFYGPRDLALGPDGNIYFIDQGNARIVKFDPATEKFSSWGTKGAGDGQFLEPTGITVSNNLIAVADNGNNRLQLFDLNGRFIRKWDMPVWQHYPLSYPDAVIHKDILYVTSGVSKEVLAFTLEGRPLGKDFVANSTVPLHNPSALAVSKTKDHELLVILNTDANNFTFIDLKAPRSLNLALTKE